MTKIFSTRIVKLIAPASLAAALFLGGCSDSGESSSGGGKPGAGGPPPKADVAYIELQPSAIQRSNQLPGRVVAFKEAEIRPQVSGIVLDRLFDEGSYVKEGQQLYQIDPALYEADLQLAEANLQNAEARLRNATLRYDRFEQLVKNKVVSQQQFDDAEAELNQSRAAISLAEAEVRRAQINLDYTQVRSPISGYIGPSAVTRGALLTARQLLPLATVRQLDPVYVDLSQTAAEARRLQEKLVLSRAAGESDKSYEVSLYLGNANQPYSETGTLDATDLSVDARTGAIRLRSIVPNPDRILLPGLFVRASIKESGETFALLVPQKCVMIGQGGSKSVWLVSPEGSATRQSIEVEGTYQGNWVVREGLQPGDKVIVEGRMNLMEGAALQAEPLNDGGDGSDKASAASPDTNTSED